MTAKSQDLQYIESNPRVCHGQWVFKGTRIMVRIIREQLERGMTPEQVIGQWRGDVSLAAIDEVMRSQVKDPSFPLILIDENVPEAERLALRRWKPAQIGYDFWNKGVLDDQICIRLRAVRQATFFSLDRGFFTDRRQYAHPRVAIVFVDSPGSRFAVLVDRFLRHPSFRTHASRMGRVFNLMSALSSHGERLTGYGPKLSGELLRGPTSDAFTTPPQLY